MTVNVGLVVGTHGTMVDTWDSEALNPDFSAIDGMLGGVQTISLSNIPVTLAAPAGFTATPGAGPVSSQNRVLKFSGTLTADVTVTLPLPCAYICENNTTGAFNVILRGATATEVIALPPGETVEVYNDGSRVRFVGLARAGQMEMWAGLSVMPIWVGACTVKPYLLCNGTVYNISDFPTIGGRFLSKFGGNGLTTFGVPDMGGRVPLAYDQTGTRITVAVSGINGQTLGGAGGTQGGNLAIEQIPTIVSVNANQPITVESPLGRNIPATPGNINSINSSTLAGGGPLPYTDSGGGTWFIQNTFSKNNSISTTYTNNSQQVLSNVPPAQVTGIWVVKT